MGPLDNLTIGELLGALVATANECGDATPLLHDTVTLHRLDGERLHGRDAVVDAISTRGSEARLRVLTARLDAVVVGLEIEGVPGVIRFEMHGSVQEGRLVEIWMRG